MLRRTLHFVTCVIALALCAPAGTSAEGRSSAAFGFERYEVLTGLAGRPTALTAFLSGGPIAELVVLSIDDNGGRRLRVYAFDDGAWAPRLDTDLNPGVLFADVADIAGHDRLITYDGGRLRWFDPETATERVMARVTSSFSRPRRDEIPHVDVTRDVNHDERDDLVVPDVDGFWVLIQVEGGAFADPVKVGPPTELAGIYGADGYRYDPWSHSRIHEVDYNGDGRSDLVFWNDGHFEVHEQDERGLFSAEARTFTTAVTFDSDHLYSLAEGEMAGRVLHSLADMNGDGVGDLVVFSLQGRRISSKHSAYEVHFGTLAPDGGTVFAPEVGATFRSDGKIQLGMERHDLDRDGRVDLMITTIDRYRLKGSLWKRLKGFMGDGLGLELEFYRMGKGGGYPDTPDASYKVALEGAPTFRSPGWVPLNIVLRGATHESRKTQRGWPRLFNSNLLLGDVTGNGRSDLLIEPSFRELLVFEGVPRPGLFARQPEIVKVIVPNDVEYTWLVDVNRDGKQDILMHHPFTERDIHGEPIRPPGEEPHRIAILIAR